MEATQSLKVQRLQTGFVDVKNMGYPTSQNQGSLKISPVQASDQIDLKNQDQQQKTENADKTDKALSDVLNDFENKINQMQDIGVEFTRHKASGRMMVRVVEKGSNTLIREIPSEEFLDMVVKMDQMIGILFDKKV